MTGDVFVAAGVRADELLSRLANVRHAGALVLADCPAAAADAPRHNLHLLPTRMGSDSPVRARGAGGCLPEAVVVAINSRTITGTAAAPPPSPVVAEVLLSLPQAGAALNLHPRTVRARIRDGSLPGSFLGGRWRIRPEDLRAFVALTVHPSSRGPAAELEEPS